ncbi:MAG: glycine betaine ABC transporter substrate-binding protein [Chloroflexota bacterium]
MQFKKWMATLLMVIIIAGSTGLIAAQDAPTIRVGSKNFEENILLGNLIMVMLEENGYTTEDFTNLGRTLTVRRALLNNQIDVYPEYTSTGFTILSSSVPGFVADPAITQDSYEAYSTISSTDAAFFDVTWLRSAPASNSYAIALRRDFAEENGLVTISDFADYVNNGGEVFLVSSEEFAGRSDGLPGIQETYGFELSGNQILVITGAPSTTTEQGVRDGVNGINSGMAFATDGTIDEYGLVLLEDNLNAIPLFQPTPTFRGEVIRAYPDIVMLLNPVFESLTADVLRGLNAEIQVNGRPPREVAEEYLTESGFIGDSGE